MNSKGTKYLYILQLFFKMQEISNPSEIPSLFQIAQSKIL